VGCCKNRFNFFSLSYVKKEKSPYYFSLSSHDCGLPSDLFTSNTGLERSGKKSLFSQVKAIGLSKYSKKSSDLKPGNMSEKGLRGSPDHMSSHLTISMQFFLCLRKVENMPPRTHTPIITEFTSLLTILESKIHIPTLTCSLVVWSIKDQFQPAPQCFLEMARDIDFLWR